jgi:hypothetical protein
MLRRGEVLCGSSIESSLVSQRFDLVLFERKPFAYRGSQTKADRLALRPGILRSTIPTPHF